MSEALRHGGPEADGVDVSMLKHISPIEWSNVLLYGQYVIDRNLIRRRRPPSPSRRRWRCDRFLHGCGSYTVSTKIREGQTYRTSSAPSSI